MSIPVEQRRSFGVRRNRLVAAYHDIVDGGRLRRCACIGGNRARHFWCGRPRHGNSPASNGAVVLSAVLARLCWQCDGKTVRTASRRIGASRTRPWSRLCFSTAHPRRTRALANLHRGRTGWRHAAVLGRDSLHLPSALFSLPRLRSALGPRLWRISCTMAMEYIALVFAVDFIRIPLYEHGLKGYPLSYVPFALMLIGGFGLRVGASARTIYDRRAAHRYPEGPRR